MTLRQLVAPTLSLCLGMAAIACGSSGDSTPGPNPGAGPAQGTGGATQVAICDESTAEDHTSDATVTISFAGNANAYTPACVRVAKGAVVSLPNSSVHPLHAMTTNSTLPNPIPTTSDASMTSVSVTFDAVGAYGFFCAQHGADEAGLAAGMSGAVFVQ